MDHSFQLRNLGSSDLSLLCWPTSHFSIGIVYRHFMILCRSWIWGTAEGGRACFSP